MVYHPANGFVFVFIILALLSACGGGSSSGGDSEPEPGASNTSLSPTGDLNPGLSGKIFFQGDFNAWTMDMASGSYTKIPNTNWQSQKKRFPGVFRTFNALPVDYNNVEFIVRVNDCKKISPDALAGPISCIVFQSFDGTYTNFLEFLFNTIGARITSVKLSRDSQYLAVFRNYNPARTFKTWLQIVRLSDLEVVSEKKMNTKSFDWLPDGRLIYFDGKTLNFTSPYSTEIELSLSPFEDIEGRPRQLAVSPDGARLAFVIITAQSGLDIVTGLQSTKGTPYIMNIDGTGLRELATTPEERPVARYPKWSPDGKFIMIEGEELVSASVYGITRVTRTYLVPSEDMGKTFMLYGSDSSPEVRLLRRYKDVSENSDSTSITTKTLLGYWIL